MTVVTNETGVLRVRGLHLRTGGGASTLVRGVDLDLARGEVVGIVGESGSGKSLTARALVGLCPPGVTATGSVRFDGTDLIDAPPATVDAMRGRRISMVLQDPFTMLNPLQSARAHVSESIRTTGPGTARRADVDARLAEVGIGERAGQRYPFQLSGGMRQRVAIAAALAGDPALFIADEPTTALDTTTQAEILALLRSLTERRGMSMLLITHDLQVAFSVCDRIVVMYGGSVVEQGTARELAHDPRHPYTAALLASELDPDAYQSHLHFLPGNVPRADDTAGRCAFAARCDFVRAACVATPPVLRPEPPARADTGSGAGRLVACHRTAELGRLTTPSQPSDAPMPPASAAQTPLLRIVEARTVYRTRSVVGRAVTNVALDGVSLDLPAGAAVGLVGESGSGKTTVARSVLGLGRLTSGSIHLGDLDITDARRLRRSDRAALPRRVQAVFQDPYSSLNPSMSIGATLGEAIRRHRHPDDLGAEIAATLDLVGLPAAYADRRPVSLSGGERQRVAIARAVAVRPELLVCDEPVAALDVSVQAQILELLRELRRSLGMAMLFITHDLAVVRQMTDTVVVLNHGTVVETGRTEDVLDRPTHPYTRRLVDAVPRADRPARIPTEETA